MDKLPALGTAISTVIPASFPIYMPLLQSASSTITSTPFKTHTYGPHPRQELDIYTATTPPQPTKAGRIPVLIFLHGGGLVRGSKSVFPLVYANLGHFFASHGFITIIPNYRLIEHGAKFPSGGEDIALVVSWLHHNLSELGHEAHERGIELSMMGNSAGGLHLATYLLAPHFSESRHEITGHSSKRKIWLEKAVFLAVPFDMRTALPERKEVNQVYWGDRIEEDVPWGLLRAAKEPFEGLKGFLVLTGTLDPSDEILSPNKGFVDECRAKGLEGKMKVEVMEGHNHVSPVLGLGTGIEREEKWGVDVVEWLRE